MNRLPKINGELKVLWEQFLSTGCPTDLIQFVNAHPETTQACAHAYPALHRLADFTVANCTYRVSRCATCHEQLTVASIASETASEEQGVPYSLSGKKLRKWVADEETNPSKGPCDWASYEDSVPNQ